MSIIPTSLLENELPDSAENGNNELSTACARATGFVNTWTSKRYDPWDNFNSTNNTTRAPDEIVSITINIAKLFYFRIIGTISRDEEGNDTYTTEVENFQTMLTGINISPLFVSQTVSLDSNYCMLIGSRTTTSGIWTRVIPANANITSAGSSVYVPYDDFYISKGGDFDNEYPSAWYLRTSIGSSVEGTLNYMRTFRKDMHDYLTYMTS